MRCPFCGHSDSKVIDSRPADDGNAIRRRRECIECEKRFTTYEKVESLPLIVIKKDKTRQQFDREKLLVGITRACEKRPVETKHSSKSLLTESNPSFRTRCAARFPAQKSAKRLWRGFAESMRFPMCALLPFTDSLRTQAHLSQR